MWQLLLRQSATVPEVFVGVQLADFEWKTAHCGRKDLAPGAAQLTHSATRNRSIDQSRLPGSCPRPPGPRDPEPSSVRCVVDAAEAQVACVGAQIRSEPPTVTIWVNVRGLAQPPRRTIADRRGPVIVEARMPAISTRKVPKSSLDLVRRYVGRHGFRGADRDDLVQEIFLGASRSLPRYDPRLASVRTWLLRIAFNHIANERKRAYRRHEEPWPEEALDGLSSPAPDSETRLIEAQQRELLADLLLEVPPMRRELLVAHDLEEEAVQDEVLLQRLQAVARRH